MYIYVSTGDRDGSKAAVAMIAGRRLYEEKGEFGQLYEARSE